MNNTKGNVFDDIYHDIIDCLVGALEAKDLYTCGHSERVADMTYHLATHIGIKGKELEVIHMAAHLHDIGKIGVPDEILNKKGKLSESEWIYVKKHPEIGYKILSRSENLKEIANIILCHHERWDGEGYPNGLLENQIPLGARIIAICDAIDAMISERPYRKAFSLEKCRMEVEKNKGLQFDPSLVEKIESLWAYWKTVYIHNK